MADIDNRLGAFLRARRELALPAEHGLPAGTTRRRVPGLRREEVAMLAGVSADYYVRLEQGRDKHPSEQVIDALARVFGLDDDGVVHLRELARPVSSRRHRSSNRRERVSAHVQQLLDTWSHTPAMVVGRYLDVLANNRLAEAVNWCSSVGDNQVRVTFLDTDARASYSDWEIIAQDVVANLRAAVGADLNDPNLTELVGELSLKSDDFRRLWARHDVRPKTSGTKRFNHPMVGDLKFHYETFPINSAPGQMLIVYHAEPGSPSERALALLGSATAPTEATR